MIKARVTLLTGFIPPYRLPLYQELTRQISEFRVLLSTPMEANRKWPVDWADLDVHLQKTITIPGSWKHPSGFNDELYLHFPYDTLTQLFSYQPNVIISCELGARSLQATWYRSLRRNTRLILWELLSEHTEQGRGKIRAFLRKWLLRHADAILVNGESGARYIARFGVPDTKIFRVQQASYSEIFSDIPLKKSRSGPLRLLSVGQLIERKGLLPFLHHLNKWAKAHPDRSIEYTLAGHGPQFDLLANQQLSPNLHLRLLGHINYPDMPDVYSNADILAFPTLADEWGLVVNEAMAAGLPILGSLYSQAVEELVQNNINGWTFRPDYHEDVERAIDCALTIDTDKLNDMCAAARARAVQITPKVMVEQFLRAINSIN